MDDLINKQVAIDKLNEFDWQELYLPFHFKQFVFDELPAAHPEIVRCDDMLRRLVEYEFRKINSYPMTITGIEQALNEVPTIQSQQKTGHCFDVGSLSCRCSECGGKSNRESRYCPHCGAKWR